MTIRFIKDRPPFKEGEMTDVAPQTAEDYIKEGSAVDSDETE